MANEVQDQRKARLAEPRSLSFRPERLPGGARAARGKAGGGVLAQRRTGGGGSRSGNSEPVTHGNRLRDRLREERARRERFKQKERDPVGAAKGYVAQIGDKQVRRAIDSTLEGAKKPPMQSKRENLVNLEKDGGRKRAVSDFERAVREAGGDPAGVLPKEGGRRQFTARDGTVIMYRSENTSRHGRTNEIHILRPGEEKAMIKIRYPDPPAKEIGDGPAYP